MVAGVARPGAPLRRYNSRTMSHADQPPTRPGGWDTQTLRDPHKRGDKAQRVRAMFNAIAPTYERVNTIATFGRDAAWRRRAVSAA